MDNIIKSEYFIYLEKSKFNSIKESWVKNHLPNLYDYILDKLGAGDVSNLNRTELCETLLNRLLYLELMERSNPTSTIKYLYDYWECQPIPDKYN